MNYRQRIEAWWKKHAGAPDDPTGFGINLMQLIFWSVVFGIVVAALAVFG